MPPFLIFFNFYLFFCTFHQGSYQLSKSEVLLGRNGNLLAVACGIRYSPVEEYLTALFFQELINNFLNKFIVLFYLNEGNKYLSGIISQVVHYIPPGIRSLIVEIILSGEQSLFNTIFSGTMTFGVWENTLQSQCVCFIFLKQQLLLKEKRQSIKAIGQHRGG